VKAHAICEKPLVINPWNLDQLAELEAEFGRRVYTVLQLRHQPDMLALKKRLLASPPQRKAEITLTYVSRRGQWYDVSWKGDSNRSGGLAMNLGIHFFDLLMWLLGPAEGTEIHLADPRRMAGVLELERARVRWFLSVDANDLPEEARQTGKTAWRSLQMDGEELEFSAGFEDLHTRVYEEILAGRGLGIEDVRPSIELLHRIRIATPQAPGDYAHPLLSRP
jgi:UDP-N-acetyl-2-amino-2-deoxyglucuronate dehydrogenase